MATDRKQNSKNGQKKLPFKSNKPSLLGGLMRDVFNTYWLISLLGVMAVLSAMFQAKTTHDARKAVAKSQQLREQRQQYEIELQSLRLEITSLTEANRISSLAKQELDMIEVNTNNEKIITL
jgi:cell division protein FtsL